MLNSAAAFPTRTQMLIVDTGNVNAQHTQQHKACGNNSQAQRGVNIKDGQYLNDTTYKAHHKLRNIISQVCSSSQNN